MDLEYFPETLFSLLLFILSPFLIASYISLVEHIQLHFSGKYSFRAFSVQGFDFRLLLTKKCF